MGLVELHTKGKQPAGRVPLDDKIWRKYRPKLTKAEQGARKAVKERVKEARLEWIDEGMTGPEPRMPNFKDKMYYAPPDVAIVLGNFTSAAMRNSALFRAYDDFTNKIRTWLVQFSGFHFMLICNAGIMELPKLEQVYGIEKQFVVNYLGHFILVNRLLDRVKAAKQGRIVVVSSGRYKAAPPEGIQFDNLSGEKGYDPLAAYGQSKLAIALFAQELSRRLEGTTVTSNSVLPGVIMTNLGRYLPSWKILVSKLMGWTFMRSVEQGVATTCYVVTNPELAKVSGEMFLNCKPITPEGSHISDTALATKLWNVSVELTKDYL